MRWFGALLLLAACGPHTLAPSELPTLQPGASVKVHVWPPGTPGPGRFVTGTFQSQDANAIVVRTKSGNVDILKAEIHDDTRNVP